jgi:hypothetical protein
MGIIKQILIIFCWIFGIICVIFGLLGIIGIFYGEKWGSLFGLPLGLVILGFLMRK